MKKLIITGLLMAASAASWAKLPPPSDEAKAKAAEAAAKTAWVGKQDAYLLCKSQDRVAAHVKKTGGGKPAAKDVKDANAKDSKDAKAVAIAAPGALPACADPGPFVYTPPEAVKPLEAAGAHSPAATAKSPPSTNTPAAAVPAKKN